METFYVKSDESLCARVSSPLSQMCRWAACTVCWNDKFALQLDNGTCQTQSNPCVSMGLYSASSLNVLNQIEKIMEAIILFILNRYSQDESPSASRRRLSDTGRNVFILSRLFYFLSFMLSLTFCDTLQGYLLMQALFYCLFAIAFSI